MLGAHVNTSLPMLVSHCWEVVARIAREYCVAFVCCHLDLEGKQFSVALSSSIRALILVASSLSLVISQLGECSKLCIVFSSSPLLPLRMDRR